MRDVAVICCQGVRIEDDAVTSLMVSITDIQSSKAVWV